MTVSSVDAFRSFLTLSSDTIPNAYATVEAYEAEFHAHTTGQNAQQAAGYAGRQLEALRVDEQLLAFYDRVTDFTQAMMGEGYVTEDVPIVEEFTALARRLSSNANLTPAAAALVAHAVEVAVTEDGKRRFLARFLQRSAATIQELRISRLEGALRLGGAENSEVYAHGEDFTTAQMALAFHYLFLEGLDVRGVDQTEITRLAHLLSARKIPLKDGRENLQNSSIRSAFGRLWAKGPKAHLADLRFVLRFFKPFEGAGSPVLTRVVAAIEAAIAQTLHDLEREQE